VLVLHLLIFFFFNPTPTTEIYTLSLHDALPILITVRAVSSETIRAAFPLAQALTPGLVTWRSFLSPIHGAFTYALRRDSYSSYCQSLLKEARNLIAPTAQA